MSSQTQPANELRLFQGSPTQTTNDLAADEAGLWEQIPTLAELMERFETVTGWELAFKEQRPSAHSMPAVGINGKLEIIDLSDRIEPGQTARHRRPCTKLVESINDLMALIWENRELLHGVHHQLCKVVEVPFDWWGISGRTGFLSGRVSSWSISANEQIRIFSAQIDGLEPKSQAIGCSTLLATFESACQSGVALEDIAMLLPQVLRKVCEGRQRLEQFASVEMDPVTGEFEIDGYESSSCFGLLDLSAGAYVNLEAENMRGVLYSGQILIAGLPESKRRELLDVVKATEMTISEFTRLIERNFADSASLFLYRR